MRCNLQCALPSVAVFEMLKHYFPLNFTAKDYIEDSSISYYIKENGAPVDCTTAH